MGSVPVGRAECRSLWYGLNLEFSRKPDHSDRFGTETWRDEGKRCLAESGVTASCIHGDENGVFKSFENGMKNYTVPLTNDAVLTKSALQISTFQMALVLSPSSLKLQTVSPSSLKLRVLPTSLQGMLPSALCSSATHCGQGGFPHNQSQHWG